MHVYSNMQLLLLYLVCTRCMSGSICKNLLLCRVDNIWKVKYSHKGNDAGSSNFLPVTEDNGYIMFYTHTIP